MANEWDDFAAGWDGDASTGLYADLAYQQLINVVNLQKMRVFDFGCGTGLLSERMSPVVDEIVALDGSACMIGQLDQKKLSNVVSHADFLTKELIESDVLFQSKFDLITASSVCAFIPNYAETLGLLKSLLRPDGYFVQWDWLSTSDDSDFGFSEKYLGKVLADAGFSDIKLSQPFEIESQKGVMPVLMAIAKNS